MPDKGLLEYNNITVAVTDPRFKHTLGIVRSLGQLGINVYLLNYEKGLLRSYSNYSKYSKGEIIVGKDFSRRDLVNKLEKFGVELLILVGTNSFRKIAPWKSNLNDNNIQIVSVDDERLKTAFSKKETYALAEKLGIPCPKTYYLEKISDLDLIKKEVKFPCVIKGIFEVGFNMVDYAADNTDLDSKYIKMCDRYNLSGKKLPMIQEYIKGYGCGFFAVYNEGKCGLTFQHRRIREYPPRGGASVCAESFKHRLLEKFGRKLLDSLRWHGVAMVEFKMTEEGIPILMEINPKFWGSLDLALEAGVNFPKAVVDIYLGKEIPYSNEYKFVKYHWPLDGDFLHAVLKPGNMLKVLADCLNPRVKSNIWFSDPMPVLGTVNYFLLHKQRVYHEV